MNLDDVKKLINSGYITKVDDLEEIAKLSEQEMVDMGYLSHVGVFDGDDSTNESEVLPEVETTEEVVEETTEEVVEESA